MFRAVSIQTQAFYDISNNNMHRPLLIGCSGGGGHNAAIEAIRQYLIANDYVTPEQLPKHSPVIHQEKPTNSNARSDIGKGLFFTHKIPLVKHALKYTSYPILPKEEDLDEEIKKINDSSLTPSKEKKSRFYVDMLLDIYDAGYESAAIWNVLQKQDNTEELKKLIKLQPYSDKENYTTVKIAFLQKLKEAAEAKEPYTEVISTQAMSLPALCDAVKEYNETVLKAYPQAPKLKIHQYMTDLPTKGAVHFFNSISQLTTDQCQQMYLYGVNFNDHVLNSFNIDKHTFAGVFSIDPQNNPMVRVGFRNEKLKQMAYNEQIIVQDNSSESKKTDIAIKRTDKIAAIMLGSQAGNDTAEYALKFALHGFDKVFVFGGKAPHIKKLLDEILEKIDPDNKLNNKLIRLDNQDDQHMAGIMVRSDVVVVRGGGLTVMEQMALPHLPNQTILVHTKQDQDNNFFSGISWEDCNVDDLISYLDKSNIQVARTSIQEIENQLTLINAGIRLQEGISAVRLIHEHFELLKLNKPDLHKKSIGSFYTIKNAIREKQPANLLRIIDVTIHQFGRGQNADVLYLKYLDQLQFEIGRYGILNLVAQLDLLDKEEALAYLPTYDEALNNNILLEINDIEFLPTNAKQLLIEKIDGFCKELQKQFKFKVASEGMEKLNMGDDDKFFNSKRTNQEVMQKKISKMLYSNLQQVIKNCDELYTVDMAVEQVAQFINTAQTANKAYKPNESLKDSLKSTFKSEQDKLEKLLDNAQMILSKMFSGQTSFDKEKALKLYGNKF